ncbi:MAG: phage holin family protein [Oscillospiraceae bacterium]
MTITGMGISSVAAITVICYLVCQAVKATALNNKWLPVIAGASGLTLGVAGLYLMPDFPASDVITAAAVGVVSGLAATGIHQIYKQMTKD